MYEAYVYIIAENGFMQHKTMKYGFKATTIATLLAITCPISAHAVQQGGAVTGSAGVINGNGAIAGGDPAHAVNTPGNPLGSNTPTALMRANNNNETAQPGTVVVPNNTVATPGTTTTANVRGQGHHHDWETEKTYWQDNYHTRRYYDQHREYTAYEPAYHYGVDLYNENQGKPYQDLNQADLLNGWNASHGNSALDWKEAQQAVRDSYDRLYEENHNPNVNTDTSMPVVVNR